MSPIGLTSLRLASDGLNARRTHSGGSLGLQAGEASTDHDDWSTGQIIAAYRDAWHVEQTFRDLKHPQWLHGQPQFHWTDDKIRVHGFICVLAVILVHLLHRECVHAGIDLSLPALLQELTSIHEVAWMYPQTTRLAPQLTLTERTPRQQQLLDLFAIPLPAAPTR